MKLYLINDYRQHCGMSGRDLTEKLVKEILEENGISARKILRTSAGKPYIAESGIHFSVSHTGNLFGCLLSRENAGLDLQFMRGLQYERLAARYFTEEEQRLVKQDGAEGFFRLWTCKEALCKFTGNGLAEILKKESVLGRDDVEFIEPDLPEGLFGCCCRKKDPGRTAEDAAGSLTLIWKGTEHEDLISDRE